MTRKISGTIRNLLLSGLVFLGYIGIGYSQDLQTTGSVNDQLTCSSDSNQNKVNYQKPSQNFYETDSIFSFCSPNGYFPSLLNNLGEQATEPLRFNTKEWIITGAAVGITAVLISIDNDIDEWARVQKQNHIWVNKASPIITQFGGYYGVYTVVATGLISVASKNEKGVQTSLLATQAMITSGVWVHLIKMLTGRERPEGAYIYSKYEGGKWYGPFAIYRQDLAHKKSAFAFDSFPSGHTAAAFSIATVFASQYRDIKVIPVISYSAATLVGISRLTEHEHWASDVFVGGFLGYVCGRQVVAHYNKTHQNPVNSLSSNLKNKTLLTFNQDGNQIGLCLIW